LLQCEIVKNLKLSHKILIVVSLLAIAFYIFSLAKDILISNKLSKSMKMPVKLRGLGIGFNLNKLFSGDNTKIGLKYLAFGEGPARINLKDIEISKIKKNINKSGSCIDGYASFKKFYMGSKSHKSCFGGIEFVCVPYSIKKGEQINIGLRNGQFKLGDSDLKLSGNFVRTTSTEVDLSGSLSRGDLKKTLACLNLDTDKIETQASLPKFSGSFISSEKTNIVQSLNATGNFILYQGKFKTLDLIKPVLKELKLLNELGKQDTKEFDEIIGDFLIKDKEVNLSNLQYDAGYYAVNGYGKIGFNGDLDLNLNLKGIESILPIKTLMVDKVLPKGLIPIKVKGTLEKPIVSPNPFGILNSVAPPVLNETLNQIDKVLNLDLKKFSN